MPHIRWFRRTYRVIKARILFAYRWAYSYYQPFRVNSLYRIEYQRTLKGLAAGLSCFAFDLVDPWGTACSSSVPSNETETSQQKWHPKMIVNIWILFKGHDFSDARIWCSHAVKHGWNRADRIRYWATVPLHEQEHRKKIYSILPAELFGTLLAFVEPRMTGVGSHATSCLLELRAVSG